MRWAWIGLWTAIGLVSLTGCYASGRRPVDRPELVEEYRLPPDDLRYSTAVTYPKEALNQSILKKDIEPGQGMPMTRAGAGQMGNGAMSRPY